MPSQRTVIWAGATAALVVGAGAGALVWTYPNFVGPVSGSTQVGASVPEPTTPTVPPARSAAQTVGPPAAQTAALASGAGAADANAPPPPHIKPSFDVVTVEPTGEAVIAGRAAPNAKVELRDGDKTLAEATADASGQFVIIPPTLAAGGHSLSLSSGEGKSEPETSNAVAVSVPLPEAPKAAELTKTLPTATSPPLANAPPPPPATMRTLATSPAAEGSRVTIQSVEADGQGGLVARGSAEPNSVVRLYLNDADLADAKTKQDGRWSLTIKHGVGPGAYSVRAEEVKPGGATVVASAEIRFDYPAGASESARPPSSSAPIGGPASEAQSSGSSPADVVMDSIQTTQVVTGHTLWALSQNYYGDPTRYPLIYEANKAQIHNPNLIFPGQVFVVPKFATKP
jgi:LysM repeat protein